MISLRRPGRRHKEQFEHTFYPSCLPDGAAAAVTAYHYHRVEAVLQATEEKRTKLTAQKADLGERTGRAVPSLIP